MNISERGNLTVGSPGKKLIAFAVPIIIINLMQAVYNVADMVIIGHFVGAAGMSAVSIGGQITTVVLVVIVAIANGAAAIIGQNFGAGNADAIGRTLRVMYSLAMIVALALTAVVICFASSILSGRPFLPKVGRALCRMSIFVTDVLPSTSWIFSAIRPPASDEILTSSCSEPPSRPLSRRTAKNADAPLSISKTCKQPVVPASL